ncbi:MAG: hypothetical protein EBX40_00865 [Gammaproteobacteria bacterium]|nr:hypothetical protein [Gammaproteobacteria bacterium]
MYIPSAIAKNGTPTKPAKTAALMIEYLKLLIFNLTNVFERLTNNGREYRRAHLFRILYQTVILNLTKFPFKTSQPRKDAIKYKTHLHFHLLVKILLILWKKKSVISTKRHLCLILKAIKKFGAAYEYSPRHDQTLAFI